MAVFNKNLFFILLVFLPLCGFGQISDSLYNALPDTLKPKDKTSLSILEQERIIKAVPDFFSNEFQQDIQAIINRLDKQVLSTTDLKFKVETLYLIANHYNFLDSNRLSVLYYKRAVAAIGEHKDFNPTLAACYSDMAIQYYYLGQNDDSTIECLHKSLQVPGVANDSAMLSQNYNIYSLVYGRLLLFKKAIYYCDLAIKFCPASDKKGPVFPIFIISEAVTYKQFYNATKEKKYADSAKTLLYQIVDSRKADAEHWYAQCYYQLGCTAYLMADYKRAMILLDSANLPDFNKSASWFPNYYKGIDLMRALCYIRTGKYEQGKKLLDKLDITSLEQREHMFIALYQNAEARQQWQTAFAYYRQYKAVADSLDIEGQKGKLFEAQQKYSVVQKEAEVNELKSATVIQKRDKKIILLSGIGVALFLCFIILLLYNLAQKRRHDAVLAMAVEKSNAEKKMLAQSLDAQLQTERAIERLRQTISRDMHDGLSGGLAALKYYVNDIKLKAHGGAERETLEEVEGEINNVYLQARTYMHGLHQGVDEMDYDVCAYLESLSVGFHKNLGVQIDIIANYENIQAQFNHAQHRQLSLLLKEVVSNTLKHADAGLLHINITIENSICNFMIWDNGKGFSNIANKNGLGMESMQERISQLQGEINIAQREGGGTNISGHFPLL